MKKIAVVGLGYVGLPLAVEFGKTRQVIGFDINNARVEQLCSGEDVTNECSAEQLMAAKNLEYSSSLDDIRDARIYIVTVPTPIDGVNRPDLRPLEAASKTVGGVLKEGDIVIYESTVFPGATEEVCVPILEKESGLKFNQDFTCGYSPERINPGDKVNTLTKIKKITSGSNSEAADEIDGLYSSIITAGTWKASSLKVSEKKIREIVRCFSADLTALQAAELTGTNRNTINRIYLGLRQRIYAACEEQRPMFGVVEVDESLFGPRRVKGKRGRGAYGKTTVFGIFEPDPDTA